MSGRVLSLLVAPTIYEVHMKQLWWVALILNVISDRYSLNGIWKTSGLVWDVTPKI